MPPWEATKGRHAIASVRERVRLGESDSTGRVYHANYLRYAELARDAYFRSLGLDVSAALRRHGLEEVVAEIHATFLASLRFDDEFDVALFIGISDAMSWSFAYSIARSDGVRCADITTTHRAVPADGGVASAPQPLPEFLRDVTRSR